MLPGEYTVHFAAGGRTLTAPLTVLADPHSLATAATLRAEHQFLTDVEGEIDFVADMIEHLEWTRRQLATVNMRFGSDAAQKAVVDAAKVLADRAVAIEVKMIDVYLTDGHEDLNRHPSQLYQKLTALYGKNQADLGPTSSDIAVNDSFRIWMEKSGGELRQFVGSDVATFNELLKAHRLSLAIEP